ncbi:unnamed protein product [Meloidogyne enterolobii]|uniref:Uncharacterized protein n=1 Tax=Meloidogyne enterolobii TaxID=390850 RepID=A0ACB0Z4G6_MELEN
MNVNLQNSNNDLSTSLCSCSTSTFEDSLNRIKLLEVEKDKTNLAFQLILAKLDLLTINSTKQSFPANNVYLQEQGLCQNQTIIKQLQELNDKMSEDFKQKQQKEKIKYLESDKLKKEEEIKILKENLEETKNDYENKILTMGEAVDGCFKIREEFEKLKEENEKIYKEKLKLLEQFKDVLEELRDDILEIRNMKKILLELNKKLEISEYLIFSLRLEIKLNKRKYEQEIKEIKDLAEDLEKVKIFNEHNFTFNEASHVRERNTEELLTNNKQLQLEIEKKDEKILSLEMEVKTQQQQQNKIKYLELDKYEKEDEIRILKKTSDGALDQLSKFKKEFGKLKEENEKILKEKLELLKELEENKLKIGKYEEDKKLELINLAKLKSENEGIFKVKNKLLEELEEYKIKIVEIDEENKELNKKLKDSEYRREHEIEVIYLERSEFEDELREIHLTYETEKNNEELLKQIKELNLEKTNILVENNNLLTKNIEKDEKISSLGLQVKTSERTINSLNVKIDELTSKLDQLNKENDKQRIVFMRRTNKINFIKNENSCCDNKCINSNLPTGYCYYRNGYVNVYENGIIKYRNKNVDDWNSENKWICLSAQYPFNKASAHDSLQSLMYFEMKIYEVHNSKM